MPSLHTPASVNVMGVKMLFIEPCRGFVSMWRVLCDCTAVPRPVGCGRSAANGTINSVYGG